MTPVTQANNCAKNHDHRTCPHPWHERVKVEPGDEAAFAIGISHHSIQIAEKCGMYCGFRRLLPAYSEQTFFRLQANLTFGPLVTLKVARCA